MVDENIQIACITESWLNEGHDHTVAKLKSFGFNISHSFRTHRNGGAVAILLQEKHDSFLFFAFFPFSDLKCP